MEDFRKNVPGWKPSATDYRLIFRPVDDMWREITNNLPEYYNMTLADYLAAIEIAIPDGCQFCRIRREDWCFDYRDLGSYVRIDVNEIRP